MASHQGLVGRRLAVEIGQGAVAAMAVATSSSPSPIELDGTYLVSPYESKSHIKPATAIAIVFAFAGSVLVGLLLLHFQRCYTRLALGHSHSSPSGAPPGQGLDGNVLEMLPKLIFTSSSSSNTTQSSMQDKKATMKKKNGLAECVVCLEEFEEGETLRLLPRCGHTFHIGCIDMWLFSHTTCPLCRCSLLLPLEPVRGRDDGNGNPGDGAAIARAC